MITVKGLSKSFYQYRKEVGLLGSLKSLVKRESFAVKAVDGVGFTIEAGESVGFIGPNGAGKTTTLKMLTGILTPTSGQVEVLGHEPYKRETEFLKKYALVMGQKSQLWWDLPPMEGFLLNKEIYEVGDRNFRSNVEELASLLEVEQVLDIPVRKLSLGQRMKCELMAALLHSPQILFLDEPTIGLDVVVQKKIRTFLRRVNKERETTMMLTSHYMEDVAELCDRVIIINAGRVVYDGNLKELVATHAGDKLLKIIFDKSVERSELKKYGKVVEYSNGGMSATLSVPRAEHTKVAGRILNKFVVDDLDIAEVSLEEVIADIFQKKG